MTTQLLEAPERPPRTRPVRPSGSPFALVAALMLCLAATATCYVQTQPDVYSSTAVLSLSPRDPVETGSDDLSLAASRYVAYLGAPATFDRIARALGEKRSTVAGTTRVALQPGTVSIRITTVGTAPERGAAIANALAAAGVAESDDDQQVLSELVVPAVVPSGPSGPPRRLLLVGGLLGALAAGVLALLALRPHIHPAGQ